MIDTVKRFVEREVRPAARALEHADCYPTALVERMRELGLFGLGVPADFGGLGLDYVTYARVFEELSRGWMSLAGVIGTHGILCYLVGSFGTGAQKQSWLPRLAAGELRGALALTEPEGGSDVANLRTSARRDGDRPINIERQQAVHHQHARGQRLRRAGALGRRRRRRAVGVRGGEIAGDRGHAQRRPAAQEAGLQGAQDLAADLRRLPDFRRLLDRRRRGARLRAGDERPGSRAHQRGRARGGRGARRWKIRWPTPRAA